MAHKLGHDSHDSGNTRNNLVPSGLLATSDCETPVHTGMVYKVWLWGNESQHLPVWGHSFSPENCGLLSLHWDDSLPQIMSSSISESWSQVRVRWSVRWSGRLMPLQQYCRSYTRLLMFWLLYVPAFWDRVQSSDIQKELGVEPLFTVVQVCVSDDFWMPPCGRFPGTSSRSTARTCWRMGI